MIIKMQLHKVKYSFIFHYTSFFMSVCCYNKTLDVLFYKPFVDSHVRLSVYYIVSGCVLQPQASIRHATEVHLRT